MQDFIKDEERMFNKLTDKYQLHAGQWHGVFCDFPTVDSAGCYCNLSKNKKDILSFLSVSHARLLERVIEGLEEMKISQYDLDQDFIDNLSARANQKMGKNQAIQDTIFHIQSYRKQIVDNLKN